MRQRLLTAALFMFFLPLLAAIAAVLRQLNPLQHNYYSWRLDAVALMIIVAYGFYRYRISTGNTRR